MIGQFTFTPIKGTRGVISENGKDLVIIEGNTEKIKKKLTVQNDSVVYQLKRSKAALAKAEGKLAEATGWGQQKWVDYYEEKTSKLRDEIAELEKDKYKEYWGEEDGRLVIPAGFWGVCEEIVGDAHLNTTVPFVQPPQLENIVPRDYQVEGVQEAMRYNRASVVVPTGAGKTLMITMMAYAFVKAGKRVCIIEPTIELVSQTKKFVSKYIPNTSGLGGRFRYKLGNDVLISTINSATKYIDNYDVIIIDEMQHSAAESYIAAAFFAVKARYFYGFTACPIRADGLTLGIHAACGPVVYQKDVKWGIENGFLSPAKICMVEVRGTGTYPDAMNSQKVYFQKITHDNTHKVVFELLSKAMEHGKKTLILYKTVQAGLAFRDYAAQRGLNFDVASSEYRIPLDQFRKGEIPFIVANSGLMAEGVDVPDIACCITCVQNSSVNMTLQILGRGLRKSKGKDFLTFFDIYTPGYKQFMGSAYARKAVYKKTGQEIRTIVR